MALTDLLSNLDAMLVRVGRESLSGDSPAQTINNLIRTAKQLLDVADELSQSHVIHEELSLRGQNDIVSNQLTELKARRFQEPHISPQIRKKILNNLYKIRRIRDELFQDLNIFGEPAWDILLDLMFAERENKSISVTSACMASCAPPTTALRWLSVLEAKGFVERTPDELDARRCYVNLTDKARILMNRFCAHLIRRELV